jgi:hypothetical protein
MGLWIPIDLCRASLDAVTMTAPVAATRWMPLRPMIATIGGTRMKWLRFSIGGLMAFIIYVAVALAALSKVDDLTYGRLWDDTYYMITILALAVATIMAVLTRGHSRARWLGFAVFGWVHLNFGWPDSAGSPAPATTYRPRFPHMTLLNWAITPYLSPGRASNWAFDVLIKPVLPALTNPPQQGSHAWHVLQTSATMLTALIGAAVGNYLASRVARTEDVQKDVRPG